MERYRIIYLLLFVALLVLIVEAIWLVPVVLQRWHPFDYGLYVEMGAQLLRGDNPYGAYHYWPLYTILWVFGPLALLPDWFALVWVIVPLVSLIIIHQRDGLILFLFTPLWWVIAHGQIDGVLLLPAYWLLQDTVTWAGIGVVLLLTKPQLAPLAIAGRFFQWVLKPTDKPKQQIKVFLLSLSILVIPSFVLWPTWPWEWLKVLPMRAAETTTIYPGGTASVWSWWSLGWWGKGWAIILIVLGIWLFLRAWKVGNRIPALLLATLFITPFLYASNLFIAAAALRGRRQIELVTALSLFAFLVHLMTDQFAGTFALVTLLILWFQGVSEPITADPMELSQ